MKATDFEFRFRGLIIGVIFWAGFALYGIDRKNVAERAMELMGNGAANSAAARHLLDRGGTGGGGCTAAHLGFGAAQ